MPDKKNGAGWLPMAMLLLGTLGALTVFILLFILDFRLSDLVFYLPGLALSALLILFGIRRMKKD